MEKHLTVVAVLNFVYRGFGVILGLILFLLGAWFRPFMEGLIEYGAIHPHEIPPPVLTIVPAILVFIAVLILLGSVAGIVGAAAVLKRREWGRILLLVVSFFTLLDVPLGTLLGGYSIWVLMTDETIRMFKNGGEATTS